MSIIIPVYNVQAYLNQCIDSVLKQDISDIEIIVVDDGSTDSSGAICDEWALKDSRICVYHKENGGLMSAWKYGAERASGTYLGFVDSDDWIEPNMFSVLYNNATVNNADMVVCGFIKKDDEGHSLGQGRSFAKSGLYADDEINARIFPRLIVSEAPTQRGVIPSRVTKLFSRELIIKAMPYCKDEVSIGEDLLTTFVCCLFAERIYIMEDFYPYNYRFNAQSMIHEYSDKKYEKITVLKKALENINKECTYDFQEQIDLDYVSLVLQQMEYEILTSNKAKREMKMSLSSRYRSSIEPIIAQNNYGDRFLLKHKLYLFLLKNNMLNTLILIRKMKQWEKQKKC